MRSIMAAPHTNQPTVRAGPSIVPQPPCGFSRPLSATGPASSSFGRHRCPDNRGSTRCHNRDPQNWAVPQPKLPALHAPRAAASRTSCSCGSGRSRRRRPNTLAPAIHATATARFSAHTEHQLPGTSQGSSNEYACGRPQMWALTPSPISGAMAGPPAGFVMVLLQWMPHWATGRVSQRPQDLFWKAGQLGHLWPIRGLGQATLRNRERLQTLQQQWANEHRCTMKGCEAQRQLAGDVPKFN